MFLPEKRENSTFIPDKHGAYDNGAKYYNNRQLVVKCQWIKSLTREDVREVGYWLSKKGRVSFPQEPTKYYVGALYDSNELTMHFRNATTTNYGEFELNFICEPFACGKIISQNLLSGTNAINYHGTAETPTYIKIRNVGVSDIKKITITAIRKD